MEKPQQQIESAQANGNSNLPIDAVIVRLDENDALINGELVQVTNKLILVVKSALRFSESILIDLPAVQDPKLEMIAATVDMIKNNGSDWRVYCSVSADVASRLLDELGRQGFVCRRDDFRSIKMFDVKGRWECTVEDFTFKVRNINGFGCCLWSSKDFGENKRLQLTLPLDEGSEPVSVKAAIKWQEQTENGFEAGFEFIDPPSILAKVYGNRKPRKQRSKITEEPAAKKGFKSFISKLFG
jgi:hypothetical protein